MKLNKLISILLIILILYIYEQKKTNFKIIDYKLKFNINYFKNIIYSTNNNLKIGDTITNNVNTYKIVNINKDYYTIDKNFIGNTLVYLNATKKEIPNYIKAIHTIYINNNIIPKQLFINKFEIVKWKNLTNNSIQFNLYKNNTILLNYTIIPNSFCIFIFNKSGTYKYFINNLYNNNIIIVK